MEKKELIYLTAALVTIVGSFAFFGDLYYVFHGTSVEYIVIDTQPHHLGDVNNSNLFPEVPNYEGQYYEKNFTLNRLSFLFLQLYFSEDIYITMKTRDIDPNAPARLRINNKRDYYLNEYVKEERYLVNGQVQNYAEIEIPVNLNDFKVGINKISISVGKEGEIFYYKGESYLIENVDDIEFWDLKIKLKRK